MMITISARGQSADISFHDGARLFVDAEIAQAEQVVDAGLAVAPDDPKLVALKALIEEEKERQQSGSDGSQQQQDESRQQEQDGSQSSGDQTQESEDQQSETDEEQESDQQSQPQPDQGADDPELGDPDDRQREAAGQDRQQQLSRAQALRILQALQNEEEQLLREVQKVKGRPRRVEKDW